MKAMVFSDLVTMKRNLLQLMGICVFVALFISVGTETLAATGACISAMIPIMYLFSIAAYDEMNKWEVFRLTLPLSRMQVVAGRYVSFLLVALVSCVAGIALCLLLAVHRGGADHLVRPALQHHGHAVALGHGAVAGERPGRALGVLVEVHAHRARPRLARRVSQRLALEHPGGAGLRARGDG